MRFLSLLWCLGLLWATGCRTADDSTETAALPPPNVVWINVEDIDPALGAYGDSLAITPRLDQMAAEGILYERAYSTAPICAPSRSSFITGVYATAVGTQHLRSEIARPDFLKTMPEHLNEAGYWTTNYGKTDWNFSADGVFDYWESDLAPWRSRPDSGQPFYSMFVIPGTHEGSANHPATYRKVVADLNPAHFHDTADFPVPPYYPDIPTFRTYWAHYYDLVSRMDAVVGEILDNLEADGLKESTIVYFFADHGFGAPRHKRYLNHSGVHVPLLAYVPEAYRTAGTPAPGTKTGRLVSLVDLVPTTLSQLGMAIPDYVQGRPFLGAAAAPRDYVFVERSRADDLFEMARGVINDRYLYVRNYMPYLPYARAGVIQADSEDKLGYSTLRALYEAGELPPAAGRIFETKPTEELYDLREDPYELNNLAARADDNPALAAVRDTLRAQLRGWMLGIRDVGLLPEPEYMIRAADSTPYQYAQDRTAYDLPAVMGAAALVGTQRTDSILHYLNHPDGGARYWAVIATRSLDGISPAVLDALEEQLTFESPSLQIAAAEALCYFGRCAPALPVLRRWVLDDRPWLALQAARSVVEIGPAAAPLTDDLLAAQRKCLAPAGGKRKYRDFNYASFTGWALEQALRNVGTTPVTRQ
ncbi:MAG: sulfatase-like hydrolase/transferase [Catalinimonas sp.]